MNQPDTNKSILAKLLVPIIALVILLIMVAWLAGSFDEKISPSINQESTNSQLGKLNLHTVTAHKNKIYEPVAASVEAKQATIISSRILARINKVYVRAGDTVQKGDKLIQLEQHDLQSQVLQAKQNVNATLARHKEAKQNYQRTEELFKINLVSEFERDKSHADFQSIDAELTASEQALSLAETTLSYATLTAPIDGRIVDRFAEPGDTAQPGSKLLSLYNPLSLRVEAQVRETLALTLKRGQHISIELPAMNKTLSGEIEEIVPAANTGSRSFLIKVRISYHENLLPGMYARLLVPAGEESLLVIPRTAITQVGQLDFVHIRVNNKTQRRFVRLGKMQTSELVSVISGLKSGDEIILP
jgi:RND family efflux transporter MFP subunit